MYRQGDILLVPVTEIPERWHNYGDKFVETGIVAEGEVTGHHHVVSGASVVLAEVEQRRGSSSWGVRQMFVVAENPAQMVHPEHGTIMIDPGTYQVIRQREYTGWNRNARYVRD